MINSYWKQPEIHHVGAMKPTAYLIPNVRAGRPREESERMQLLCGDWGFEYYESVEAVDWEAVAAQTRFPGMIPVPGVWQTNGFDRAQYITSPYPFLFDPPHVPAENPVGVYSRVFSCRQAEGERVTLHLEGADSCAVCFLNGEFLGYSEGPHNSVAFDVTDRLTGGENRLTIAVLKWCSGSYLDDQDKLRLSGLFRDVYLLTRPKTHLSDLLICPDTRGMQVEAEIAQPEGSISLCLCDPQGAVVAEACLPAQARVRCRLDVPAPVLWNAEQPALYTLRVALQDEWVERRVGLRTVAVQDGQVLVNGVPVKLLGVNRHENHPDTGYVVSVEDMRRDLEMMKAANINCVRTSHYPDDPRFYELCDEIGLYVIDEADMETHGCCYNGDSDRLMNDPRYAEAIMDREQRLVERDKSFSCVLIWSMGNESGWGSNLAEAARWIRSRDPSRLLHMESAFSGMRRKPMEECVKDEGTDLIDLIGVMYPDAQGIAHALELPGESRPVILTEYCHAMGNSLGDVSLYTEAFFAHRRLVGGCIWEWSDHGLRDANDVMRYGGDFGEKKHNGNLCADGLVSPDREPHSALCELKEAYSPLHLSWEENALRVENRFAFTGTQGFSLRCALLHNGRAAREWTISLPEIAPGDSAPVPLEAAPAENGETVLRVEAQESAGRTVCTWHHVLKEGRYTPAPGKREMSWGYRHGMLHRLCAFYRLMIESVKPTLWRAPLDNDRLARRVWEAADQGENLCVPACTLREQRGEAENLHVRLALGGMSYRPAVEAELDWKREGCALVLHHRAQVRADYPFWLPRYGLQWTVSRRLKHVAYYGFGPGECYEDKRLSCHPGLWRYDALARRIPYVRPQEWGSSWNARFVTLTDDDGRGVILYSAQPFSFNVQPWTPEEMTAAAHPGDLPASASLTLNTDLRMSGVGSASVGPELPPEHRIEPGDVLEHTLYLAAFDEGADDPFEFLL